MVCNVHNIQNYLDQQNIQWKQRKVNYTQIDTELDNRSVVGVLDQYLKYWYHEFLSVG